MPPFPELICGAKRGRNVPWNVLAISLALGIALKLFGPSWLLIIVHAAAVRSLRGFGGLTGATVVSVLLHETGHLIAALLLRFEVLGGSLGPVRGIRLHGKWSWQYSGRLLTGSVIALPRRSNATWRQRMLCVVAAGPAATFLTMLVSAGLLICCAEPDSSASRFLSAMVELNFFLFVLGLFPNASSAQLQNDARLFFSLLQKTREAEEILVYHLLTQLRIAGLRPREYPAAIVKRLAAVRGKPEICLDYATAIVQWAVDRGDDVTADAWDKRALDLSDFCDLKRQSAAVAASGCIDVLVRDDLSSARVKFADVDFNLVTPAWFEHRAKAAYWLASGRIVQALAEIARARYSLPNKLPYFAFESELLGRLHRRAISMPSAELVTRHNSRAI